MVPANAHIVAVFARERDRSRAAPHGRVLKRLPEGSMKVGSRLTGLGAMIGFVLAALITPAFAWIVGRIAGEAAPRPLLLGATAGVVGAALGALVMRRGARAFEREINAHLDRGRVVSLLDANPGEADTYCRKLESQGALEAMTLPPGLDLDVPTGDVIPFARLPGERQEDEGFGVTMIVGQKELPAAAARLEDAGVRVAFIGRTGHTGPVSSTAGPAMVHAPPLESGDAWWQDLAVRHGRPIHVRLTDGELVLLGDARRIALLLAGHRNDTIGSALARLAERFGCPDGSARIVTARIDEGGLGVVVSGPLDARRRAAEALSTYAVATSEGTSAGAADRVAA